MVECGLGVSLLPELILRRVPYRIAIRKLDTPLYRDMVEAIETGREPVCSGAEGRKALELVLGIYESAATGKPVRFPLSRGSTMDYVGRFDR